jgi:hypothetical protein
MRILNLTQEELTAAQDLAQKIKDSKDYTRNWDVKNITVGLLGEIAYANMTGNTVCTEVWANRADGGIDFEDGTDVKTITWGGANPELKMNRLPQNSKRKKLVLAVCEYNVDPKVVKLVGEISIDNFKLRARLKTYGEKSWYAVTEADLDRCYS